MYRYEHFTENNKEKINAFIKRFPFAVLSVAQSDGEVMATQVPLLFKPDDEHVLIGHVYKNSDHYNALIKNPKVLLIFQGPNAYISAEHYPDKQSASTWNYMSVQIRGRLKFLNQKGLEDALKLLTNRFENPAESPSSYEKIPQGYIARLSKHIAGFEIEIKDFEATFKLSQNQTEKTFDSILKTLENQGGMSRLLGDEMRALKKEIFE